MSYSKTILLHHIIYTLEGIDMKVSELAASVVSINDQILKARNEILAKISELELALGNVDMPAEAVVALDNLRLSVQAVDDVVPDAVTP